MKYNKIINAEIWSSLSGIAEYITSNIWNKKDFLLPSDYDISLDELKSEVYSEMGYLINNYKAGDRSLKTYIFEYLQKRVITNIFNDYNKVHSDYLKYIDAGLDKETNNENHQYGEYDFVDKKDITQQLEENDLIKNVYSIANKIDKMIMEMIYDGISYEIISKEIGISKGEITKRMRKYGK
jgi:DNA-directed RNA polymerase specialized sigma24 family protein